MPEPNVKVLVAVNVAPSLLVNVRGNVMANAMADQPMAQQIALGGVRENVTAAPMELVAAFVRAVVN